MVRAFIQEQPTDTGDMITDTANKALNEMQHAREEFRQGMRSEVARSIKSLRNSGDFTRDEIKEVLKKSKEEMAKAQVEFAEGLADAAEEQATGVPYEMKGNVKGYGIASRSTSDVILPPLDETVAPEQTPTGLPKNDTTTPKDEKLKDSKAKKKPLTFGQKVKKYARAAIKMSPTLTKYSEKLEDEESKIRQEENGEEPDKKHADKNSDANSNAKVISKQVLKLLKKIEENTRKGGKPGGTGDKTKPEDSNEGDKSSIKAKLAEFTRGVMGNTHAGSFLLKSYDATKAAAGHIKNAAVSAYGKYNELGGAKGIAQKFKSMPGEVGDKIKSKYGALTEGLKNWSENSPIAKKLANAIAPIKDKMSNGITKIMNSKTMNTVRERFSSAKNLMTSKMSTVRDKISGMNPFGNSSDALSKIEANTREGKKVPNLLSRLGNSFTSGLGKLGSGIRSAFSKLPSMLGGAGKHLSTIASKGKDLLQSKMKMPSMPDVPGMPNVGSIASKAGPMLSSAASTVGTYALPAAAVAAAGYAGWKAGGWISDKINSGIESVTGEKGASLGSKIYDWMHPEEKDKYNTPTPTPVKKAVPPPPPAAPPQCSPAPATHKEVPAVIEAEAAKKEATEIKFAKENAAANSAPVVAAPVTNINNSSNTTSIRIHPRNQESTWNKYLETRYAI